MNRLRLFVMLLPWMFFAPRRANAEILSSVPVVAGDFEKDFVRNGFRVKISGRIKPLSDFKNPEFERLSMQVVNSSYSTTVAELLLRLCKPRIKMNFPSFGSAPVYLVEGLDDVQGTYGITARTDRQPTINLPLTEVRLLTNEVLTLEFLKPRFVPSL